MGSEETDGSNPKVWRYLRPLVRGINPVGLTNLDSENVILISAITLWCDEIQPGDYIEIVDECDLTRWFYGQIIYCKKVSIKNIEPDEFEHSLLRHAHGRDVQIIPTVDDVCDLLTQFYGEIITPDTVVTVEAVHLLNIDIPGYALKVE